MSNWIQAIGRRLNHTSSQATGDVLSDRLESYIAFQGYYNNTIYKSLANGGQREVLNGILGNAASADLEGLYNPVGRTVDLYQHVFGGEFGVDILAETENEALRDPLRDIWKWSNINQAKQQICQIGPNNGNCGLRILMKDDPRPEYRRVYIKPEHPRTILDVDLDDRGNVIEILLQYDLTRGVGEDRTLIRVREHLNRESFKTWRLDDKKGLVPFDTFSMEDNGKYSILENNLGFVPYVVLGHNQTGETWSTNAYYRAMGPIDRLNALATHINVQIHRHVKVKWFVAAAGEPPREIDLGDLSVAYVNTRMGTQGATMLPMVAPLNLNDAITQSQHLLEAIEDELPEIKATAGRFLSGQSGDTVAQLRKPAEDRIAVARINYEDALIRAQSIALSWGVLYGMWDIGTGKGDAEAAERAYQDGNEEHKFNTREVLPLTQVERNVVAQGYGSDVSLRERLRVRGIPEPRIDQIIKERDEEIAQEDERQAELAQQQQQATARADSQRPAAEGRTRP